MRSRLGQSLGFSGVLLPLFHLNLLIGVMSAGVLLSPTTWRELCSGERERERDEVEGGCLVPGSGRAYHTWTFQLLEMLSTISPRTSLGWTSVPGD